MKDTYKRYIKKAYERGIRKRGIGMRERRKLKTIREFWCEEYGMGTVEIILIIVAISMYRWGVL